jgi:hypothetical protein
MIIFSEINATATTGENYKGLAAGIPNGVTDLEGWKGFELYLACLTDSSVEVNVQVYGYGEGEAVRATVEEVAYMYQRLKMRADFLESRCENLGAHKFSFDWEPSALFN